MNPPSYVQLFAYQTLFSLLKLILILCNVTEKLKNNKHVPKENSNTQTNTAIPKSL